MKKIEVEVFTTAFQMEMDESGFVIVYFMNDREDLDFYRYVLWWDDDEQQLQDPFTLEAFYPEYKMTGWSMIPFYSPEK